MSDGYVYIISNPDFPGYLKIGIAENIKARLSSYQTASPRRNYKVEYKIYHPNCRLAEKQVQESLKMFALKQRNEWFEVSLQVAIDRLNETLIDQEHPIHDVFQKAKIGILQGSSKVK